MKSTATTVKDYLASLPADRRAGIEAIRKVILRNLDKDYEESMLWGMIGYAVPHRVWPLGYHCDPKKPLMMVGGGGWNKQASEDILAFARAFNLPVCASFRCQDLVDNRDPHYVGDVAVGLNPKLAERIKACDLLLVVGARLGEWTTANYTLVDIPKPAQKLVHVHAGAEELGRVYQGELLINSGMPEFAAAAKKLAPVKPAWDAWTKEARAELEAWQQPVKVQK